MVKNKKITMTCIVRKELAKHRKVLNKKDWEKVRDKLKSEYCGWDSCFLCPFLKIGK